MDDIARGRGFCCSLGDAVSRMTAARRRRTLLVARPVTRAAFINRSTRGDLAAIYGVGASIFSRRTWRKKDIPPSVTREPRSMMPRKISQRRQIGSTRARELRSTPLGTARARRLGPSDARREKWLFHAEAFVMNRQTRWRVGRARWCAPRARRHGRMRGVCAAHAGSPRHPRRARA